MTRTEMVVDAVAGHGDVVADGSAAADHYVLNWSPQAATGCLNAQQLALLRAAGERVQRHAGLPQDIEWAIDPDGVLWLLQSRAITTGAAMAHGPTVAREYGIPAVICVREATQLITTGTLITVDGAAGTVVVEDAEKP